MFTIHFNDPRYGVMGYTQRSLCGIPMAQVKEGCWEHYPPLYFEDRPPFCKNCMRVYASKPFQRELQKRNGAS